MYMCVYVYVYVCVCIYIYIYIYIYNQICIQSKPIFKIFRQMPSSISCFFFVSLGETKKKKILPPTLPVPLWLLKTNDFCLLLRQRLNQVICPNVLVFKTFSTCCHFLLYIACFFHCLLKFFPPCFKLS